ncbi:hypothetical protein GNIT_3549 [Glaciecola nitratireducens FR1064]|uniref:Uncharacterized protein n=1 Tax=Glaciecola nitratireducens (strain JCM 12485 / KCTC 12276 / FR1064) TaxID=1085623 RepID=G4QNT5_GLANF|nr:hypothetical protein GNIT_3549 [Glaciecola nitratireducens FR1064]
MLFTRGVIRLVKIDEMRCVNRVSCDSLNLSAVLGVWFMLNNYYLILKISSLWI